jgi:polyribonucleotide nucleotidyltransferase
MESELMAGTAGQHVAIRYLRRCYCCPVLCRGIKEVRNIECEPEYLPRVHGSAFFQRGDTHVLVATTLGQRKEAKIFIPADGSTAEKKTFFLHYDFPPYCTGELGPVSGPNRRMLGHGALAEKAVAAVMPRCHLLG